MPADNETPLPAMCESTEPHGAHFAKGPGGHVMWTCPGIAAPQQRGGMSVMANDLLTLEEREAIRREVEAEVRQAEWEHAVDVVYG